MLVFAAMLLLGAVIGFVGAGGAGVMITLLTVGFDVPIHTALGTSLAAMAFTTLSGSYSHSAKATCCAAWVWPWACSGPWARSAAH